ncbi:MAG: hypothetical protein H7X86_11635, partial [Gorillibacterium sp.]|nr:hypothetical protein [Gorillibacterium sp.]
AVFSPEQSKKTFSVDQIGKSIDLKSASARSLLHHNEGRSLSFLNLLFFQVGNLLEKGQIINEHSADRFAAAALSWIPKMQGTSYRLIILGHDSADVFLLVEQGTIYWPEPDIQVLVDWDLDAEAQKLAIRVGEREWRG